MATAKELTDRGFDFFAKGDADAALETLRQAAASDPGYVEAWRNLAMVCGAKGLLDEAVSAARRVVEIDPDDHLGYVSLSMLLQRQGKIPEAEDAKAEAMAAQMRASRR
jgi:tetratricopeptide (TPR) repeat protein